MPNEKTAVIIGAGFSRSVGVPDYSVVMSMIASLLDQNPGYDLDAFEKDIDKEITKHIRKFLTDVFDWDGANTSGTLPSLEQVFTFIDLSANSGHNLGKDYTPGKLRALRRFLIYKLFLIIDKLYAKHSPSVQTLLRALDTADFISLNWDIVLEQSLTEQSKSFCYDIDEIQVKLKDNALEIVPINDKIDAVKIAKVHGSANWAYCDNCRKTFYMKNQKAAKVIQSGIYVEDIKRFYQPGETHNDPLRKLKQDIRKNAASKKCPICGCALGSHIATFSYNKAIGRTHAFDASWKLAKKILDDADKWIFIGYSLPEADYEFAHLLKCAHKRGASEKEIIAVMKNDPHGEKKYQLLFGEKNVKVHNSGIEDFVRSDIET
jgi:NAD-dependent SIR2 family protein deacetylase